MARPDPWTSQSRVPEGSVGVPDTVTVLVVSWSTVVVQVKIQVSSSASSKMLSGVSSRPSPSLSPETYLTGEQVSSVIRSATSGEWHVAGVAHLVGVGHLAWADAACVGLADLTTSMPGWNG